MLEEGRYLRTIRCCGKLPGGLIRQAEHTSKTRIPLNRAPVGQAEASGKGELVLARFLCLSTPNPLLVEACVDARAAHFSSARGHALL